MNTVLSCFFGLFAGAILMWLFVYANTGRRRKRNKRKISFGKTLMVAIVLMCLEIIIYAEIIMIYLKDPSALYALIGIVAALAAAIWAYCEKSGKENSAGGITYDLAMKEQDKGADREEEIETDDGLL